MINARSCQNYCTYPMYLMLYLDGADVEFEF